MYYCTEYCKNIQWIFVFTNHHSLYCYWSCLVIYPSYEIPLFNLLHESILETTGTPWLCRSDREVV